MLHILVNNLQYLVANLYISPLTYECYGTFYQLQIMQGRYGTIASSHVYVGNRVTASSREFFLSNETIINVNHREIISKFHYSPTHSIIFPACSFALCFFVSSRRIKYLRWLQRIFISMLATGKSRGWIIQGLTFHHLLGSRKFIIILAYNIIPVISVCMNDVFFTYWAFKRRVLQLD